MIRKLLDRVEPLFKPGGKLARWYPLYEAQDTFFYTPAETTHGHTHVRDAIDTKRMMSMVIVALIPCILMACYNTGYQAQKIIAWNGESYSPLAGHTKTGLMAWIECCWNGDWRYHTLDALGIDYRNPGSGFLDVSRLFPCFIHGLLYFLPVYIATMAVGGLCEVAFCIIRRHEVNEGFLVTGMLFPLTLPPDIPLWQVALGIAFGVVIGKEIFGGTGKNFLNPALTGRAFLYFAYARDISGNDVWTAVDGYTGATALGAIAEAKTGTLSEIVAALPAPVEGQTWWQCFIGDMHGSMGETSVLCCLIGAAVLIATRVGSWRIMAGTVLGMAAFSVLLWVLPFSKPIYDFPPWWHLVLGGFAFGTVFMATDPVSASMTELGKWYYGALIGVTTVIVRSINPAFPEGIMLAILFANVFAPLIDYFVVQANVKRRAARYAA